VYLGATSRYVVDLATGGQLTVLRPNVDDTHKDAASWLGRDVRLAWKRRHGHPLRPGPGGP
jgi:hypothetical protein